VLQQPIKQAQQNKASPAGNESALQQDNMYTS